MQPCREIAAQQIFCTTFFDKNMEIEPEPEPAGFPGYSLCLSVYPFTLIANKDQLPADLISIRNDRFSCSRRETWSGQVKIVCCILTMIFCFILPEPLFAQDDGRANLNMNIITERPVPVTLTLKNLFHPDSIYLRNGQSEDHFYFENIFVTDKITGIENEFISFKNKILILENPSSELDVFTTEEIKSAGLFDFTGRKVGDIPIIFHDDFNQLYRDLHDIPDGMYVVITDRMSFRFAKSSQVRSRGNGPDEPWTVRERLGEYIAAGSNSGQHARTSLHENFRFLWADEFGVIGDSVDYYIPPDLTSEVNLYLNLRELPYFTLQGSLSDESDGYAFLDLDNDIFRSQRFENGSYLFDSILTAYERENMLVDKHGTIRIRSLDGSFRDEILDLSLSGNKPGQNVVKLYHTLTYLGKLIVVMHNRHGELVKNYTASSNGENFFVEDTLKLPDISPGNLTISFSSSASSSISFPAFSRSFEIRKGDNFYTIENIGPVGNLILVLLDNNGEIIRNYNAFFNGENHFVSDTLGIPDIPTGSLDIDFSSTENSTAYFSVNHKVFMINEGNNYGSVIVPRESLEVIYELDVDDTNNRSLKNMETEINGEKYVLPPDGRISIKFLLDRQPQDPDKAVPEDLLIRISGTSTSYQIEKDKSYLFTLREGKNIDRQTVTTIPFDFRAQYTLFLSDKNSRSLENITAIIDGKLVVLPENGKSPLHSIQLTPHPEEFWRPLTKNINIIIQPSDSSYMFTALFYSLLVNSGEFNDKQNISTIPFEFYGTYSLQVSDVNKRRVDNNVVYFDQDAFILNQPGMISKKFKLDADKEKFWQPAYREIKISIIQSDSSYQHPPVYKNITLNKDLNDQIQISSIPFSFPDANLILTFKDGTNNLPDVLLTSNGRSIKSNASGTARINNVVAITTEDPDKFWLPGTSVIKYSASLNGYDPITDRQVVVSSGDNYFSEKLNKSIVLTGSVSFKITGNGSNVNNAIIEIWQMDDQSIRQSKRTSLGQVSFTSLPLVNNQPTKYVVKVSSDDLTSVKFNTTYDTVELSNDQTVNMTISVQVIPPPASAGGVVLTFDDHFINEWYQADLVLRKYNWKATFNVCCINSYTTEKSNKLLELKNAGHEIANHSLKHQNALDFIADYGPSEYIRQEILPVNDWLGARGIAVKSFAYPFGKRNDETDILLFNYFDILRGVGSAVYWKQISDHNCFFDNSPLVYGFCIDESQTYFQNREYFQYITDLLTYARDNNKILILLAHKTIDQVTDLYETKISTLDFICNFMKQNNMKYYTLSELKSMIK
jgi:peptidoglycan-N-acetylglucosamine deacetylase